MSGDNELRPSDALDALADSMGIPRGSERWRSLAEELAIKHVPGFKEGGRKIGRKQKWNDYHRAALASAIAILMANGLTKASACDGIAKRSPWMGTGGRALDGDSLARQCNSRALKTAQKDLAEAKRNGSFESYWDETFKSLYLFGVETEKTSG